jgi:hypothetical protein
MVAVAIAVGYIVVSATTFAGAWFASRGNTNAQR